MKKSLGIDPGTKSFDLFLLGSDDEILYEESIQTEIIANKPYILVEKILSLKPDIIIGPSGYGLPFKKLSELKEKDKFLLTLVRKGESIPVLDGMKKVFKALKGKIEMIFIPGVIHLPTIPEYRKYNKIDMGTADKLAICFLAVEMHSRIENISYENANFSLIEIGYGYNAAFSIFKGKIVDGIGGTNFPGIAFLNSGVMDGELAYLLGKFKKDILFKGGASYLAEGKPMNPEDFKEDLYEKPFKAFCEGILKAAILTSKFSSSNIVYLSGRLIKYDNIFEPISKMLFKEGFEVRKIPKLSEKTKEAAQGEAMIGLALLKEKYEKLLKHMEIDKASGTILDYIYYKI